MKKIIMICVVMALAFGLVACGSSDSSSEKKEEVTLESYFADNPDKYDELLGGMGAGLEEQGMTLDTEVKGNDIVINMDVSKMFKDAGIDDIELAKAAFDKSSSTDAYIEKNMDYLKGAMQRIKDDTGVEEVNFVYKYKYDGEEIKEIRIDKDGIVK